MLTDGVPQRKLLHSDGAKGQNPRQKRHLLPSGSCITGSKCALCVYSSICQQEMRHFHTNRPRICCHLVNSWATHTHTHTHTLSLSLYIYIYDTHAPNTHKTHRHILTFYYMTLCTNMNPKTTQPHCTQLLPGGSFIGMYL